MSWKAADIQPLRRTSGIMPRPHPLIVVGLELTYGSVPEDGDFS